MDIVHPGQFCTLFLANWVLGFFLGGLGTRMTAKLV